MKNSYKIIIVLLVACVGIYSFLFFNKPNKELSNEIVVNNTTIHETEINKEEPEIKEEVWEDNNPIKLGIYDKVNGERKLIKDNYEISFPNESNKDIKTFNVYYTNEETIDGSLKPGSLYLKYFKEYDDIEDYRIGYNIKFDTQNKKYDVQMLEPKDTESIKDYLNIYFYDTVINLGNDWYSYLTNDEYNDKTILQAIRIATSTNTNLITSDITITAFTYDKDDFDDNNIYKGISSYSINIINKK